MRRPGRRSRTPSSAVAPDPFIGLGATYAWLADNAVDNGANTTTIPSYVGSLTLTRNDAAGQSVKSVSANFGKYTIAFAAAFRGYSAAMAVPAAMSFAFVGYVTANNSAFHAVTVGGALNTGNSSAHTTTANFGQKVLTATAGVPLTKPAKVVALSIFDAAGVTFYSNSLTPVTASVAGALVGDTLTLGALDTGGSFTLTGEFRTAGLFNRALTSSEARQVVSALGRREGVVIAP